MTYRVLLLLAVLATPLAGCRPAPQPVAATQLLAGRTMGTTYSIKFLPAAAAPAVSDIARRIDAELQAVNAEMSTYIPDSELSRFNASQSVEWETVSLPLAEVVSLALDLSRQTEGAFDITVGPLVELWGFGPGGRRQSPPDAEQLEQTLAHTGYDKLEVRLDPPGLRKSDPKLQLDLSAIAKGHGVDRLAAVLDDCRLESYFIEIGGEIRTRGVRLDGQAWQVGIERPAQEKRELLEVVGLSDACLATSGDYRNFYELGGRIVAHTIDPRTGKPAASDVASASVVAESCALADGVATAMMSAGLRPGLEFAEQHGWAVLLVGLAPDGSGLVQTTSSAFDRRFPELAIKNTGVAD